MRADEAHGIVLHGGLVHLLLELTQLLDEIDELALKLLGVAAGPTRLSGLFLAFLHRVGD